MGSGTWRKAYGALKDSTKVGLANFNSEYKDLDIAIVKATNHVECPPKERHFRRIMFANSANRPRADVAYSICTLARRLSKTKNWIVALKTLIVIHRLLREGDGSFKDDFLSYSYRGNILQLPNFRDDSSPLDERVECFRVLKYDVEADRLVKLPQASGKPEGTACTNHLIQYALALVLKESFKIYCSINDGIINLVDMYFDMAKMDAIKALEIYKRAGQQAEKLSAYYDYCKNLELAKTFQFPTLRQPPSSFLATMEEYIREAPSVSITRKSVVSAFTQSSPSDHEDEAPQETEKPVEEEKEEPAEAAPEEEPPYTTLSEEDEPPPLRPTTGDLLNLDEELHPMIANLEQSNALALAIVEPGSENNASAPLDLFAIDKAGWELALVTAQSNHASQPAVSQQAGGFDKLLLDSLYEDDARRQQIASVTYTGGVTVNPFDPNDPFAMSNSFAPPSNVQFAMMGQQQQQYYQAQQHGYFQMQQQQQHQMLAMPSQTYQQQQAQYAVNAGLSNPFGDPFSALVTTANPPKQNNQI
uniref:ENTH domain-containing protein n=1 Tax=Aegilops tauschii subsp. strangulata TaxID=200361 RepID=A0A453T1V5_AEGTS